MVFFFLEIITNFLCKATAPLCVQKEIYMYKVVCVGFFFKFSLILYNSERKFSGKVM